MIKKIALLSICIVNLYSFAYENPKSPFDSATPIINGDQLHLHVIRNYLSVEKLNIIKAWIDSVKDVYEDFDKRIGITWDDYWLEINSSQVTPDTFEKNVYIDGKKVRQYPKSIFSFAPISKILLEDILPVYFKNIGQHVRLPEKVYMQTFVIRTILKEEMLNKNQLVHWHQDPSEYNTIGDYTLVLMLSDPKPHDTGWNGGELLVKNGLPTINNPALEFVPAYNQAIMFNNKLNSHMVKKILPLGNSGTRDVMIINVFLSDPRN